MQWAEIQLLLVSWCTITAATAAIGGAPISISTAAAAAAAVTTTAGQHAATHKL